MKKKTEKDKKKKTHYVDDGHTVYDMSAFTKANGKTDPKDRVGLSRKEKRAAIRAGFARFLPALFIVIFCFFCTMLLMRLWLHA